MDDEQLGRKIVPAHMSIGYGGCDFLIVGRNARELLAKPPARPRMMIEGMSVEDIGDKMQKENSQKNAISWNALTTCADVAHRLATTPAPEVDPDAEADDVTRALEKAAEAVLERFFGGSFGLKEYAEAIARDHARAAVLAFLKEMPDYNLTVATTTVDGAPVGIGITWTPSRLAAAIEKEQP